MATQQCISPTRPSGLPGLCHLTDKAAASGSVIVYQPYLDSTQRAKLDPRAEPFDISFNKQPQTREYELFQVLHEHHTEVGLAEDIFWGLVSSKFELKAPCSFQSFVSKAIETHEAGADAYLCNPLIGHAAIYSNVWEHALMGGHPGMEPILHHLKQTGHDIALQGGQTFFFCNYFVGNQRFWKGYFEFCEDILHSLERQAELGTAAGRAYRGAANYGRDASAAMRPFVIERLLGLYVSSAIAKGMRVVAFKPSLEDFLWRFAPPVGTHLHQLYEEKENYFQTNDMGFFNAWQQKRIPVAKHPHLVWHADDPPIWVPPMQR